MTQTIKRILLIKFRHHGDVLLSTPLVESLKYFYPDSEIDFLIYKECEPLLKNHPDINKLLFVDRSWKSGGISKRILEEFKLAKKIYQGKYDLVLNLTEGDRGAFYVLCSKAKVKVGIDPCGQGFLFKSKIFTHLANPHGSIKHVVESQLDFLRVLKKNPPYEKRALKLVYSEQDLGKIKKFCGQKTILVHAVSRWMFKAIPINVVKFVIQKLIARGYKILITGSNLDVEKSYNQKISEGFLEEQVQNLTGQLSILELSALIDSVDGMITCDSLPLHISSVYKKPVVAVFGPTSSIRWAPWRNPNAKIYTLGRSCQPCYQAGCQNSKESDCLTQINPEEFYHVVEETIIQNLLPSNEF